MTNDISKFDEIALPFFIEMFASTVSVNFISKDYFDLDQGFKVVVYTQCAFNY